MMTTKHLTECPLMQGMSPEALAEVAAYFQTLSEPTRLAILNLLREGERSVGEIAELTGYTAANVSRHLAQLAQRGFIARTSRGTSAYYKIADDSVYALCDLVCGNIARQYEKKAQERNAFVRSAQRAVPAKRPPRAK